MTFWQFVSVHPWWSAAMFIAALLFIDALAVNILKTIAQIKRSAK